MYTTSMFIEQSSFPPTTGGSQTWREMLQLRQDQKIAKFQVTWLGTQNYKQPTNQGNYAIGSAEPEMAAEVDGCDPTARATGETFGVGWAWS